MTDMCPVCSLEIEKRHPFRIGSPTPTGGLPTLARPNYCECDQHFEEGDERDIYVIQDWRGMPIQVGDKIVYPYLSGRSALLAVGIVRRIYVKRDFSGWNKRLKVEQENRGGFSGRPVPPNPRDSVRKYSTLMYWNRCMFLEKPVAHMPADLPDSPRERP